MPTLGAIRPRRRGAPGVWMGRESLISLGGERGGQRVGAGVLAGEDAGGALVEAADLAAGELVEEELAFVVEGLGGDDLAAEIAEVGEPVAGVEGELGVDLFAQALREGGAGACGGDGDLKVAATDDGGELEVAEGWVVDGVAEDVGGDGLVVDGAVDGGVVGGGDDEEEVGFGIGDVAGGVGALVVVDLAGGGEVENALAGVGGDDGDVGVGGAEGFDLGLGEVAGTEDEATASGELEEDGEKVHDGVLIDHSPRIVFARAGLSGRKLFRFGRAERSFV
jgi:hypothetical protein